MFRRQQPIGPYFVDFYCNAARLAVEIDGPAHWDEAQSAYDLRRQAWLESEETGCSNETPSILSMLARLRVNSSTGSLAPHPAQGT